MWTKKYVLVVATPIFLSSMIHGLCLFDEFDDIVLLWCSARNSVGHKMVPLI